jgi:hypothetical protein
MATNGVNGASKSYKLPFELANPDLFHTESYIDAEWVTARSGKRFEVVDPGSDTAFASCPDNGPDDVDAAMQSSYKAVQAYSSILALVELPESLSHIAIAKATIFPAWPLRLVLSRQINKHVSIGC